MASRYPGNYGGGSKENGTPRENPKDNVFDLDSAAFASDQFRMHEFKVKRCPRARPHDWTQCPFAHPGEKARRRDPRRYKYSGTACPEFRKSGCCRRGDACPFAHGVFECWLHPSRYRTQLCTDGTNCKRRVCFFAHIESELRHPEDDPGVAQKQVQAELAAEVQTLQQQHLTHALQALLLQTANPTTMPERSSFQMPALTLEMLKQHSEAPPSEMLMDPVVDHGNSTAALQLALLQQLAAKEQQLQNMNDKSVEVQTSSADTGYPAPSNHAHHTEVYDALSHLKHLAMSVPAPMTSSPAVGLNFDSSSLLSQLMPNGTTNGPDLHSYPLLIDSLMSQNGMKVNGQARRSIDNSLLTSLIPDASTQSLGSMGYPVNFQNGAFMAGGNHNGMAQDSGSIQIPVSSNGAFPVVSHPAPTMYSVENIQRLLQNPAFSSNLSHLFQMNPALLEQLTSTRVETNNPGRHSIDNAYLSRLNTDMGRFVNNNGMQEMASGAQATQPNRDSLMMNGFVHPSSNDSEKLLRGAIGPEALLQEFNALKLQLGSQMTANARQNNSDGYNIYPPHSSPDSDVLSSEPRQSYAEDN